MLAEIAQLVPHMSDRITVLQDIGQLPERLQKSVRATAPEGKTIQGFVRGDRVYLFADGIKPGTARAVFMHEVGDHRVEQVSALTALALHHQHPLCRASEG